MNIHYVARSAAGVVALCAAPAIVHAQTVVPYCSDLHPQLNVGTDCQFPFGDHEARNVFFDYNEDVTQLIIKHRYDSGEVYLTSDPIDIEDPVAVPVMRDFTADGQDELLIGMGVHADHNFYEIWGFAYDEALENLVFKRVSSLSTVALPHEIVLNGPFVETVVDRNDISISIIGDMVQGNDMFTAYSMDIDLYDESCSVELGELGRDMELVEAELVARCESMRWNALFPLEDDSHRALEGPPLCSDLEPGDGPKECILVSSATELWFRFGEDKVELSQTFFDGRFGLQDELKMWGTSLNPGLRDLDGDDVEELLIPLGSDNVNTEFAVWQVIDGAFAPAGVLLAFGIDAIEIQDGMIISSERGSAATYTETGRKLTSHGFTEVYTLDVDYSRAAGERCALTTSNSLSAFGVDADALLARCEASAN